MKYIKLYETTEIEDIKEQVEKLLVELDYYNAMKSTFPKMTELKTDVEYSKSRPLPYKLCLNYKDTNRIFGEDMDDEYQKLLIYFEDIDGLIYKIFNYYKGFYITDENVDKILNNNPEYFKYYKKVSYFKHATNFETMWDHVSDNMKDKYAYLQNDLF